MSAFKDKSVVSQFDELWRLTNQTNTNHLEEFLSFVISQEDCRLKWLESVKEVQRLKLLLDDRDKENIKLDLKLTTARKLLDQERQKKLKAEEEKNLIERQLQMVRDMLFTDNRNQLHDETREKLKFLNSTTRSRLSNDYNDRLSAIQELDSTGSILSDLSFSRSEDDLDIESFLRKQRTYKKHRPSAVGCDDIPSAKRRRSHVIEANSKNGMSERMVATTTVTMDHEGSISAQSQIETIPSAVGYVATAPVRAGSLESVDSGLTIENSAGYIKETQTDMGVLPIGSNKINIRNHVFTSKTVIRPEDCDVCEKRMKFSSTVLKCQNCRACCHPLCKDSLPLPCIAPGSTPISKKNMGVIADYAQSSPPMVPALIIHCLKEVEERGLNEPGVYRVPGSEKEVRALKEKFMRNRGVPRLTDIDIHVICGCLKDFLRNLKEPLVTHRLWWQFTEAVETFDKDERRSKLYQAISQLPQPNKDTLGYIILHLLRVVESKETNKMSVSNLATVLGPTVVGYSSDCSSSDTYAQTTKAKLVLEQFLTLVPAEYWHRIMSKGGSATGYGTPRILDTRSHRTPSTRSFKKLFDSPSH